MTQPYTKHFTYVLYILFATVIVTIITLLIYTYIPITRWILFQDNQHHLNSFKSKNFLQTHLSYIINTQNIIRFDFERQHESRIWRWCIPSVLMVMEHLRINTTGFIDLLEFINTNFMLDRFSNFELFLTCVDRMKSENIQIVVQQCLTENPLCLSIGKMPEQVNNQVNWNKPMNMTQPFGYLPEIYFHYPENIRRNQSSIYYKCPCSITDSYRLTELYRTLQKWIEFADEHGIMWWITYGTLLGSIRTGYMIPYDTDMDIAVLGSVEPLLRKLQTRREDIKPENFNVILRPGEHCIFSEGDRLACNNKHVNYLSDSCSFCGPLGRVFYRLGYFIDIYPIHIQLDLNYTYTSKNDYKELIQEKTRLGYFDEGLEEYEVTNRLYNIQSLFPLRWCKFMDLNVPCPHEPVTLLQSVYGDNFMIPKSRCNVQNRTWE